MTGNCRCSLSRVHTWGRLLTLAALLLAVFGPLGCVDIGGAAEETVEFDLIPGETRTGSLLLGQGLRAVARVQASHVYELRARLTEIAEGSTLFGGVEGLVSGAPLAQPVTFFVESASRSDFGAGDRTNAFTPHSDGQVELQFTYALATTTDAVGGILGSVRGALFGADRATYELLITDVGFDDNGTSIDDAVPLAVGPDAERTGTLNVGDEADYFLLQVQAGMSYQLRVEATESVIVSSGGEDRFGQVNLGIATPGGLTVTGNASAGAPGTIEFTAPATEEVLLLVAVSGFDGAGTGTAPDAPIEYAISVVPTEGTGDTGLLYRAPFCLETGTCGASGNLLFNTALGGPVEIVPGAGEGDFFVLPGDVASGGFAFAATPGGLRLYLATNTGLYEIDGQSSFSFRQRIAVPGCEGMSDVIALDDGTVVVTCTDSARMVKIDPATGSAVDDFVCCDDAPDGFDPYAIAIAPTGLILAGTTRISSFNPTTGAFVAQVIEEGVEGATRYDDFIFGSNGNLYVSANPNIGVLEFDRETFELVGVFVQGGAGGASAPTALALAPTGNLFVAHSGGTVVSEFDRRTGDLVAEVARLESERFPILFMAVRP